MEGCDLQQKYVLPDTGKLLLEPNWNIEKVLNDCVKKNQNSLCKQRLCKVETYFSLEIIALIRNKQLDGGLLDSQGFDREDNCPLLNNLSSCLHGSNKCCSGEYPKKWTEWVCVPQSCPKTQDDLTMFEFSQRRRGSFGVNEKDLAKARWTNKLLSKE